MRERPDLQSPHLLDVWSYSAISPIEPVVLPDGCQDIIVRWRPGRGASLQVSARMVEPWRGRIDAGERLWGLRLMPGASVDRAALAQIDVRSEQVPERLIDRLDDLVVRPASAVEILAALASPDTTPGAAAAALGVSLRALQRQLRQARLPPPQFWTQLVRVRRAARAVRSGPPIAHLAHEHGFSDQAHMGRAFQRWLGTTPRRLRDGADDIFQRLQDLGYD